MFIYSRFVLVDDKEHHLVGLKRALDSLRLDCHSKLYSDETVADWVRLPGTRILFLDQNLTTGATFGSGDKVAFAALQEVIQKLICPDSGPYGLILWAEQPELEAFKKEVFERFTGDDARFIPAFFAALRKGDYINTATGGEIDAAKLRADILTRMSENPQMKALMTWEADCAAAVDAVLRSVVDLVPLESRRSADFSVELGKVLYRLSQAGAGVKKARDNPRESVNHVLVPILADRISVHDPDSGRHIDWNESLVDSNEVPSLLAQAAVNTAIHQSPLQTLEGGKLSIKPTDLGSVIEFPFAAVDEALQEKFGVSEKQLRGELFRAKAGEWADCKLRLVQIGASCDQAQPKPGPLLYLLGIEWSFANLDGSESADKPTMWLGNGDKFGRGIPCRASEWQSPVLRFPNAANPGKLSVFKNLSFSCPPNLTKTWVPVYRLREALTDELTQEYARYISRPGIVTLPAY
jgi:hypothetical protein